MIGTQLAHYRITAKLGEGGMGEVYRADDSKLGREVAIKVLPAAVAQDAERLARFEREAKVLASLNHANIAAIYGLEESGPTRALVMELVEGATLAERLEGGALPLAECVRIARQIAEALEAAHAKGIVHRDLKPANVKLTDDGKVKVLDFGLAKALDAEADASSASLLAHSPTLTAGATLEGVILGTAAYMSPNRRRVDSADRRSDVWSLGVILWEMLSGRRLFAGESVTETLAAVLREEVPLGEVPATTPGSIRRLLRRCLERDPAQRLHDVADVRIVLADVETGRADDPTTTPGLGATGVPTRGRGRAMVAALTFAAVAFVAGWALRPAPASPAPAVADDAAVRQLTFEPGLEAEPTFSPDGNYLAYATNDRGSLDIAILPLAGGEVRRLVDSAADESQPAWSPDGTRIAFTSAQDRSGRLAALGGLNVLTPFVEAQGGDLFLVPAGGGTAARLAERASYPTWSPDGREIAFQSDRGGTWDIWKVPARGGEPTALLADEEIDYHPAWSPDGAWIAFASAGGLRVARSDGGGAPLRLVAAPTAILSPAWSPDGRYLYFSWNRSGYKPSLWRLEFRPETPASVRPERISLGEQGDIDVALSPAGGRLAWSKVEYAPDIWELERETGESRRLTTSSSVDDYPHLAPDGRTVAFMSDRSGYPGIWTLDRVSGATAAITPPGVETEYPRWSPDGRSLVFVSADDAGGQQITIQERGELSGRVLVRASRAREQLNGPQWSPDGRRIVFVRAEPGAPSEIVVVSLAGEERVVARIPAGEATAFATFSGDGAAIFYQHEIGGQPRQIWSVPAAGGEPRQVTRGALEHSHPQTTPSEPDAILIVVDHKNLALVSAATGELSFLTDFDDSTKLVDYPSWSSDGRRIEFSLTRKVGDLFLIENPDAREARVSRVGERIGHYQVAAKLGEGGMGEVWSATDTRLGRQVAIKLLPEAVARDPERLARFEREAQLLASLNHPHIAQVYGLETSGETYALAMELVPGPTLGERLERGAPPLDETLAIARQIASALESAHEKRIVHRDLKPANVKLTGAGEVKVLDFGLAKAMEVEGSGAGSSELAHSPTLTMGATVQGMILGTAAYMAPEQAKALPVDKRADIWAFGVILHEMLTGGPLFAGDTVGDTLAAVIRADLDLDALPESTPPALCRLVRRCLERKPANRLRDIGDARIVIDEVLAGGAEEARRPAAAAAPRRGAWLPWTLAALAAAVAAWALLRPAVAGTPAGVLTADLALAADQRYFFQGDWGAPAILAPDGESIVFGAQATQGSAAAVLWTRSLATGAGHPIEGTAGAYAPFFSPDGRSVGFFAEGKLKTVPVEGGPALTLAETPNGRGGAWAPDGTIVYSPGYRAGLFLVSARGGEPRPLTQVDASKHSSHRWPALTADGRGVVFLAVHHSPEFEKEAGLRFVRLDGGGEHAVLPARLNGAVVGGRLLYLRETTLFAQRIDGATGELEGEAAPVARNVLVDATTWRAAFSATPRRLVYATGSASGGSRLSWLDRSGRPLGEVAKTGLHGDLRLSPDGKQVVESRGDRNEDLWMIDLERGAESRFTFDDTSEWSPVWSPDGRFVYYVSTNHPDGRDRLLRKRADSTGTAELLYESTPPELDLRPDAISPDGRVLALGVGTGPFDSDADLALLPLDGSGALRRLFETPYQEGRARFLHDGRFLAFATAESGVSQVVVVSLDRSGDEPRVMSKWQVSLEGGGQAVWSAKDDEIVFLDTNNNLMSVAVTHVGDGSLRFGTPTVLFSTSAIAIRSSFDLAADGRILVNHFGEEQSEPLRLIENWAARLSD